ncbi:MAG: hypothetical protein HUJ86_03955 [Synergistes sp.]|nr:hypothetical protein [Synergistes sp.]
MSLAQITEKIKNDAQKEADEILSKAKGQADFINQKAGKECDEIKSGFDARFENERPEIFKRREIVANLDIEKMKLQAKRDLIADVYAAALANLAQLPREEYLNFCESLLGEAVSAKNEQLVIGEKEKYIDAKWLAEYNKDHGTELLLSDDKADIAGGFIIVDGRKSIDCSWDMLVKVLQEKQESDVVKRLFPSE